MKVRQTLLLGAGGVVIAGLFLLVREVRQPPRAADKVEGRAETNPLTDVAGRGPSLVVPKPPESGLGAPPEHDVDDEGQPIAAPPAYVLPADLPDPTSPGQGTEPLALPGEPVPPDPFTEPEIAQDPTRGGRTE